MCGIAGLFLRKPGQDAAVLLHQMVERLAHRGPDDEGYLLLPPDFPASSPVAFAGAHTLPEISRNLDGASIEAAQGRSWKGGFGHRRLSIFDLSAAGHQPMQAHGLSIVFNGAIYNFWELRKQLEADGYVFHTQTDTEVLLALYHQHQERCLPMLEGMFAFAILDPERNHVFAARDRLGVKPFYYVESGEGFAFASEQKALYPLPFLNRRLSKTAVFEFLVKGQHECRNTGIVKAVLELLPGYCLEVNLETGNAKSWEWFKTDPNLRSESYKESSYKRHRNKVSELLKQSVAMRLRSDVSLGACLSGGIDSSAIVCLASEIQKQGSGIVAPMPVFTSIFPGEPFDESVLAQETAHAAGAHWFGVSPTDDELMADLVDFVRTHDVPLQTPSTYAQYRVMQAASAQGVRITLDGQGADELFGGYALHFQAHIFQLIREGRYRQAFLQLLQANNNFANRKQTLKNVYKRMLAMMMKRQALEESYRSRYPELAMLRGSFWDTQKRRLQEELTGTLPGLNRALTTDLSGPTMRGHLRLADRNSMRFGVESRVPFADSRELIEYVQRIPAIYKIKNGENKSLLRSAVRDIVPEAVMTRRDKTGFEGPNKRWIEHMSPILKEAIGTPGMEEFMHINQIRQNWDPLLKQALATDPHRLFRMAALGLWMKEVYRS